MTNAPKHVRHIDRLLSTADVSTRLRVPQATLRDWRHNNYGPPSFALGRNIKYDEAELNAWVADQKAATGRGGQASLTTGRRR